MKRKDTTRSKCNAINCLNNYGICKMCPGEQEHKEEKVYE